MIKLLTIDQLPEYAEVIRRSFATVAEEYGFTKENFPTHYSFAPDERFMEKIKDGYYPYGYFADGKIAGFAALTNKGNLEYEIGQLCVLHEYRCLGYGKALLDFCKEKVRELGGNKINISISENNISLKNWYTANGFVHIGTQKYDHIPVLVGFMEIEKIDLFNQ